MHLPSIHAYLLFQTMESNSATKKEIHRPHHDCRSTAFRRTLPFALQNPTQKFRPAPSSVVQDEIWLDVPALRFRSLSSTSSAFLGAEQDTSLASSVTPHSSRRRPCLKIRQRDHRKPKRRYAFRLPTCQKLLFFVFLRDGTAKGHSFLTPELRLG